MERPSKRRTVVRVVAAWLACTAACTRGDSAEPANGDGGSGGTSAAAAGRGGGAGGVGAGAPGGVSGSAAGAAGGDGGGSAIRPDGGARDARADVVATDAGREVPASGGACVQLVPRDGLVIWLSASAAVRARGDGRVTAWGDLASGKLAASLQDRPAAFYDTGDNSPAPTAPVLAKNVIAGRPVVRFDGERDELTVVGPPVMKGATTITIAEVAATTRLRFPDPKTDFCQSRGGGPTLETNCESSYFTTFFWPDPGVPFSAITMTPAQQSVVVAYGVGTREINLWWKRPQSIGSAFSKTIGIHDGLTNHLFVDGVDVHTYPAQDAKAATVNAGGRLDVGVGRFNFHWAGDLAELVIYRRALPDAERKALESYFDCMYFGK